jgi:CheY-like chemotaxis protein
MKKKIIVADDNDDALYLIVTILQNKGYEVLGLKDGSVIMEGLYDQPDLFILDKEMEDYDGMTITKFLKSKPEGHSVPIIMLSGAPTTNEAAAAAGIDLFLTKPVNAQLLLLSVNKLISA